MVDGKQKTVHLGSEEAQLVSRQIEEWRRLREEFDAWLLRCEKCADEELEAMRQATAEKGGSKRRSRRVLRPKPRT
jgi:hypothetical protein